MTLAFWMNMDVGIIASLGLHNYRRVISGSDNWEAIIQADGADNAGKLGNNLYQSGSHIGAGRGYPLTTELMSEGHWVHITLTSSLSPPGDGVLTIYRDGVLDSSQVGPADDDWGGGTLMFGFRPGRNANQHYMCMRLSIG